MSVRFCVPVIPSVDLEKSLRLWVDGLGFTPSSEMREHGKLIFCMLNRDEMWFILNRRAGSPDKPEGYEGIRLYWTPKDLRETRERLKGLGFAVSELADREYGQTEFLLTDADGYSHCFGVPSDKNDEKLRPANVRAERNDAMNGNTPGNIPSCPAAGANGTHNFPALPAALNSYTTILCKNCGGTLGIQPGQPPQFTPNTGSNH